MRWFKIMESAAAEQARKDAEKRLKARKKFAGAQRKKSETARAERDAAEHRLLELAEEVEALAG